MYYWTVSNVMNYLWSHRTYLTCNMAIAVLYLLFQTVVVQHNCLVMYYYYFFKLFNCEYVDSKIMSRSLMVKELSLKYQTLNEFSHSVHFSIPYLMCIHLYLWYLRKWIFFGYRLYTHLFTAIVLELIIVFGVQHCSDI